MNNNLQFIRRQTLRNNQVNEFMKCYSSAAVSRDFNQCLFISGNNRRRSIRSQLSKDFDEEDFYDDDSETKHYDKLKIAGIKGKPENLNLDKILFKSIKRDRVRGHEALMNLKQRIAESMPNNTKKNVKLSPDKKEAIVN